MSVLGCLANPTFPVDQGSCIKDHSCDTHWGTTTAVGHECCVANGPKKCYGNGVRESHLPSCRYNGYGDIFKKNDPSWSSGGLPDIPDCDCASYGDSLNGVCNQLKNDPNDSSECTTGDPMKCPVHRNKSTFSSTSSFDFTPFIILAILVAFFVLRKNRNTFFGKRK